MAPCKWSLIALLGGLLLIGLPNGVKPEAPTEETTTSSVKECRVHIEKALEQYWDHKEPENSDSLSDETENIQTQGKDDNDDDDDDDDDDDAVSEGNEIEAQIGDDEDEHEDDEDEDSDEQNKTKSDETDSTDDDDDDDDDDEDEENVRSHDSQESDNSKTEDATETLDNEDDDEEDQTDEDDDEQDADESKDVEISDDKTPNNQESMDEGDDEDEDNDEATGKEEESNEDRDDNEDEDEDGDVDEKSVDTSEQNNSAAEATEEDEDEDEDEEDEEDEGDEESSTEEATTLGSVTEDSITVEVQEKDKPKEIVETESDKVTGEADRASARVVSKLPEEKPSIEQSETPKVPEEAVPVTSTTKEQEPEDDEDEDLPSESVPEDADDDTIENIYEEEDDDESSSTVTFRSRDHVDVILGLDEIGTEYEKEEEKLAQSIFREIKKIQFTNIKPIEMLYKYTDSTTRVLGDAEIFNKPMLLFLGPWSAGKTTVINYLLGIERSPAALKTGTGITDVDFTLVTYGDQKKVISGTELAADWRYAGVQKFGQGFLDHFRSIHIPSTLLKRVTIVDTPGILENKKNTERGYSLNDAFQWFIDRADAIYVVLDPTKVDIGGEVGSVLDQLKGREVRFILNKADTIRRSDLMRVVGQLFWNLSPLMPSTEAPIIYAVSLTTKPYHPSAPARFLADQENNFLYDMKETLDERVENRILYARRHAVRVRNHAKMIDCYLSTYYRHKSIFSSKKNVAKQITENPRDYNIFEGIGSMSNVSRYDLPDPNAYKEFFKLHPLYDFKPLASTCSYFRGCPMDKLDEAISRDIPELFAKYKKAKGSSNVVKQEGR